MLPALTGFQHSNPIRSLTVHFTSTQVLQHLMEDGIKRQARFGAKLPGMMQLPRDTLSVTL